MEAHRVELGRGGVPGVASGGDRRAIWPVSVVGAGGRRDDGPQPASLRADFSGGGLPAGRGAGVGGRLQAAGSGARLEGFGTLSARRIEADERGAKAAMYGLNRTGRHFGELEEAWLVQALVREDGLSQVEVAVLLSRHKSWVCRRLAMMEKLCAAAQEDMRLGLLSPTMARQLVRLPAGNQQGALETGRRNSLSRPNCAEWWTCCWSRARGKKPPSFWSGPARPCGKPRRARSRLGSASQRGGQPRQPPVGSAVGSVGTDGELAAASRPRGPGVV